jgi:hypothetical protein
VAALENFDLAGPYVGRAKKQLDHRLPAQSIKVDDLLEYALDWIVVKRIVQGGRREIHQRIHEQIAGRMFEPELSIHPVDPRLLEYPWDVVSDILFQNDRMAFRASCVHQPPSHARAQRH